MDAVMLETSSVRSLVTLELHQSVSRPHSVATDPAPDLLLQLAARLVRHYSRKRPRSLVAVMRDLGLTETSFAHVCASFGLAIASWMSYSVSIRCALPVTGFQAEVSWHAHRKLPMRSSSGSLVPGVHGNVCTC